MSEDDQELAALAKATENAVLHGLDLDSNESFVLAVHRAAPIWKVLMDCLARFPVVKQLRASGILWCDDLELALSGQGVSQPQTKCDEEVRKIYA